MKDFFYFLKIILFITLIGLSIEDTCPENQISLTAAGTPCSNIADFIEKENFEVDQMNLFYLAQNNQGKITKSG